MTDRRLFLRPVTLGCGWSVDYICPATKGPKLCHALLLPGLKLPSAIAPLGLRVKGKQAFPPRASPWVSQHPASVS